MSDSGQRIGTWAELNGVQEVSQLEAGMDFRQPIYRREVFHRFYQFTLKYRVHPGCVYFALPALQRELTMDQEDYLWLCFLNGNTQNPVTSWILMQRFPTLQDADPDDVTTYVGRNWQALQFDTDRRYQKAHLGKAVAKYKEYIAKGTQMGVLGAFTERCNDLTSEKIAFLQMWQEIDEHYHGFGRLSAWSYLEYLRIAGLSMQPPNLMLRDKAGSRSHRNGLCKVLGRDDLDWHDSNPAFDGVYSPEVLVWLEEEADILLDQARVRADADYFADVNYFTLESALCTFKSCFRPNRRYPNCYADMMRDRIKWAEAAWPDLDFDLFWRIRRLELPARLRLEDNPGDLGLVPIKQNWFRTTGEMVMMDLDDPVFANGYTEQFLS